MSIVLNYIEGYARGRNKIYRNFLEISYGSLKECRYLLYFSYKEKFISATDYKQAVGLSENIGAMLWGIISKLE